MTGKRKGKDDVVTIEVKRAYRFKKCGHSNDKLVWDGSHYQCQSCDVRATHQGIEVKEWLDYT